MRYLKSIKSFDDLKTKYKKLAIANHPDNGGSIEVMQLINKEYDELFPIWKRKNNIINDETSFSTSNEFYTQNGWKGSRYKSSLPTKEIAKIIRTYCKEVYPTWKFSVTIDRYSGGASINISIMEAPYNIFNEQEIKKDTCWNIETEDINIQLNSVRDRYKKYFTESAYIVIKDVYDFMESYNFDDSDSMIDYFHVNFYSSFNIGRWDKGFKVVEKTIRTKEKKEQKQSKEEKEITVNEDSKNKDLNNYSFTISKDKDTRDNSLLYVVKCTDKLDRNEYIELNKYIKSLGGYYSKFKHGFIFKQNPASILGNEDNKTDKEIFINCDEREVETHKIQEKDEEVEEILYYGINRDMNTLEIDAENLKKETIKRLKEIGFIYIKRIKKIVNEHTNRNIDLLISNFNNAINNDTIDKK